MLGTNWDSSQKTDQNGTVRQIPFYSGDFRTTGFKVSKPGYLTYEASGSLSDSLGKYWVLLNAEIPQYDPKKIKIVLLKIPSNEAERKALEAEQRREELLLAIKRRDFAMVQKLLRDGASANTTDVNGIPAILWAAASGDVKTINALLAAGADVRDKSKSGRRPLLYYLQAVACCGYTVDLELVQRLIKAGADVNASSKYDGETVLSLAKRSGDTKIIKLLESAGARESSTR
jgi:hypothetical protein